MYSFPKAHCVECVMLAIKIAYFKTHYPLEFYCAFLNTHINEFETEMLNGQYLDKICKKIEKANWQDNLESEYNKQMIAELCADVVKHGYDFVFEKRMTDVSGFAIKSGKIKVCY